MTKTQTTAEVYHKLRKGTAIQEKAIADAKAGYCLHIAHYTATILWQHNHKVVIQGGSLQWPIIRPEDDDGIAPTHFSYIWSPDNAASLLAASQGNLPEMHVWLGITIRLLPTTKPLRRTLPTPMKKPNIKKILWILDHQPFITPGQSKDIKIAWNYWPPGTVVDLVSMRNALLMGLQPTKVVLQDEYILQTLTYSGGVWMTNQPQEIWQMCEPLDKMHGKVLIGGLGLGIFTGLAEQTRRITSVTTVEADKNIIKLVSPHLRSEIIHKNLYTYLKSIKPGQYDSAFFDIWQGTGEHSWTKHIVPLRRLARNKIKNIHCWLEDEMKGQLVGLSASLYRSLAYPTENLPPHYRVFKQAAINKGIKTQNTAQLATNTHLKQLANLYVNRINTDNWERTFGDLWDGQFSRQNHHSTTAPQRQSPKNLIRTS